MNQACYALNTFISLMNFIQNLATWHEMKFRSLIQIRLGKVRKFRIPMKIRISLMIKKAKIRICADFRARFDFGTHTPSVPEFSLLEEGEEEVIFFFFVIIPLFRGIRCCMRSC